MCTHSHYIWNPYSCRKVLVPCGHCPACLQEKACKRANRIRNNVTEGTIALFVTLTYSNDYVPYVLRDDLYSSDFEVNVYRNASYRFVFDRHSGQVRGRKIVGVHPISRCWIPTDERLCSPENSIDMLRDLKGLNGLGRNYVGVCLYSDLQKFFKRLRQILVRNYDYEGEFSYYGCSEYGGHSYRPHFHALIFCPSDYEETFRDAILTAWPYADKHRTYEYIEVAKDAASYLSSYVNSNFSVPQVLQDDFFKPKHSQSKSFGVVLDCFQLPQILQKIERGDIVYYRSQKFDGESSVVAVSVPDYVLNRYFPKFKGLSWLSSRQLRSILLAPERIGFVLGSNQVVFRYAEEGVIYNCSFKREPKIIHPLYDFSPQETYRIYVMLENCYQRFHRETGLSRFDYALYYERVWSVKSLQSIKMSLLDIELYSDFSDFYSNAIELEFDDSLSPTLSGLNLQLDPNKRKDIVDKTNHFSVLFDKLDKQKKVTNYCMTRMGHLV